MPTDPDSGQHGSRLMEALIGGGTLTGFIALALKFIAKNRVLFIGISGYVVTFHASVKIIGYILDFEEKITVPPGKTAMALDTAGCLFVNGICLMIIASLFCHRKEIK
jgi:hypothetical protein